MKKLLLAVEPVIWLLFGGGIMVGTMLLPAWLLTVGLAGPLGLLPADALSYTRLHGILTMPLVGIVAKAVLVALAALPLWKGAHHLRHFLIDIGGHGSDAIVAPVLYLIALAGSVLAVIGVLGIV